jgi:hypothetical protein
VRPTLPLRLGGLTARRTRSVAVWSGHELRPAREDRGRTYRKRPAHRPYLELLENRALPSTGLPLVWTDKPDYAPGDTVTISGSGYQQGEPIQLQVVHTTGDPTSYQGSTPWTITDGGTGDLDGTVNGNFQTTWVVPPNAANSTLELTATGQTTGEVAQATFTDSVINITLDTVWSAITTGSGTNGQPNVTDTINITGGATLTVDVPNATVGNITVNQSESKVDTLLFNSGSQLSVATAITVNAQNKNRFIGLSCG